MTDGAAVSSPSSVICRLSPDAKRLALRAAELAISSYQVPLTIETDDVHALIVEDPDITWIVPRGTDPRNIVDLWRDLSAIVKRNDPIFGLTPNSFLADAEQLYWRLAPKIPPARPIGVAGHSKGGSESLVLGGMLEYGGRKPAFLAAFEPAAVGPLNGIANPDLITRHGEDEITELPPGIGHPGSVTPLPWEGPKPFGFIARLLAYHAMAGVRDALARHIAAAPAV